MTKLHVLHQFAFSHYCEKVRWGLDYKSMSYEVVNYLPFLHAGKLKKLSGQSAVPVLAAPDKTVAGSSDILAYIDTQHGGNPLYSEDSLIHAEVRAWEQRLDKGGFTLRAALFHELVNDRRLMLDVFTTGHRGMSAWAYGFLFSAMLPKMRRMLADRAPDPDSLRAKTRALLDDIYSATQSTGYLVGDSFSAADLTAASLMYPVFFPEGTPGAIRMRESTTGKRWLAEWAEHPAANYIRRMYRNYR